MKTQPQFPPHPKSRTAIYLTLWLGMLIALSLSLSPLPVRAEGTAQSNWEEPTSFLGVKLGESLSAPTCEPGKPQPTQMCWYSSSTQNHLVVFRGSADLGFKYYLMAILDDQNVPYSLSIQTKTNNFPALKTMFIERYGPPIRQNKSPCRTAQVLRSQTRCLPGKAPTFGSNCES